MFYFLKPKQNKKNIQLGIKIQWTLLSKRDATFVQLECGWNSN